MSDLGRVLVVAGIVIAIVGVALLFVGRIPWLGRLPGDIHIERGHWSFHFPIVTSLLISALLTLVFYLIGRR
ncbi:MAG: DUF2905 domain-containing protein [Candidatus Rokuibacteriota bacterium]